MCLRAFVVRALVDLVYPDVVTRSAAIRISVIPNAADRIVVDRTAELRSVADRNAVTPSVAIRSVVIQNAEAAVNVVARNVPNVAIPCAVRVAIRGVQVAPPSAPPDLAHGARCAAFREEFHAMVLKPALVVRSAAQVHWQAR